MFLICCADEIWRRVSGKELNSNYNQINEEPEYNTEKGVEGVRAGETLKKEESQRRYYVRGKDTAETVGW